MEYIAILEKKVERGEIFVLYCQWTGNEAELEKLAGITEFQVSVWKDMGDGDNFEDVSLPMFTKCSGTFVFPEKAFQKKLKNVLGDEEEDDEEDNEDNEDDNEDNEEEAGEVVRCIVLDELFSGLRLKNYFTV